MNRGLAKPAPASRFCRRRGRTRCSDRQRSLLAGPIAHLLASGTTHGPTEGVRICPFLKNSPMRSEFLKSVMLDHSPYTAAYRSENRTVTLYAAGFLWECEVLPTAVGLDWMATTEKTSPCADLILGLCLGSYHFRLVSAGCRGTDWAWGHCTGSLVEMPNRGKKG